MVHVGSCSPGVAMVKAGNPRECDDGTSVRQFDSPRDRRVSVERHVRAVLVVVSSVRSNQSQQVALAEDDDMVEYLTPERTDEPLRVSVLPGRPGRGLELADAETIHTPIDRGVWGAETPSEAQAVRRSSDGGARAAVTKP
jgi:hypothetical protein